MQTLNALPPPTFEAFRYAVGAPRDVIPGDTAPQGSRVVALLEWAEGATGCGLVEFRKILEEFIAQHDLHLKKKARDKFVKLLQTILGLSLIAGVVVLLWYFLAWQPSLRPLIAKLSPTKEEYREGENQSITFDFQVTNPKRIGQFQLLNAQQNILDNYQFKEATILGKLEEFCTIEEIPEPNSILNTFLNLNRHLAKHSANTEILSCENFPLREFTVKEGIYNFDLKVFSIVKNDSTLTISDQMQVEKIKIAPPFFTEIRAFSATATVYVPPTLENEVSPERFTSAPIRLSWEITNFENISSITLVSLASDKSENSPRLTFDFSVHANEIPSMLAPFCQVLDNILRCQDVPTSASQVGEYVFQLTVKPRRSQEMITEETAMIPIKSLP